MKIRQVLAFAALIIGLGTASVAKADTCSNQTVTAGLVCTLNDLTFTFELVNGVPLGSLGAIGLETPSTGFAGGVATLDFQFMTVPPGASSDINLIYEVSSTSADITNLNSGFNGTASIDETGCSVDPTLNQGTCPSADVLVFYVNSTGGIVTSPGFGPVSNLWVDKDFNQASLSSFTDSVEETTTVTPEPSSIALFGTGLLAAAGALRRRLKA